MDSSPTLLYTVIFVPLRRVVYLTLALLDRLLGRTSGGIAVLCYHSIANDSWRFSTNLETFQRHMEIALAKRTPITLRDLRAHLAGTRVITTPSFLVCFDDGYHDILSVRTFCEQKGIKPVVFLIGDSTHARREVIATDRPLLSPAEVTLLMSSGWSVGSHSDTHPDLHTVTPPQLAQEVAGSKTRLAQTCATPITSFAYPKGNHNEAAERALAEAGYEMAFTMHNGLIGDTHNPFLLPRIGIERTHSLAEYAALFSPSVVSATAFLKRYI